MGAFAFIGEMQKHDSIEQLADRSVQFLTDRRMRASIFRNVGKTPFASARSIALAMNAMIDARRMRCARERSTSPDRSRRQRCSFDFD